MLGTEPGSSVRAVSVYNHCVVFAVFVNEILKETVSVLSFLLQLTSQYGEHTNDTEEI